MPNGTIDKLLTETNYSAAADLRRALADGERAKETFNRDIARIAIDGNLSAQGKADAIATAKATLTAAIDAAAAAAGAIESTLAAAVDAERRAARTADIESMRRTFGDVGAMQIVTQRIEGLDGRALQAEYSAAGNDWEKAAIKHLGLTALLRREREEKALGNAPRNGKGLRDGDTDALAAWRPAAVRSSKGVDAAAAVKRELQGMAVEDDTRAAMQRMMAANV